MGHDVNEGALEDALAEIERARNWTPRVISRLEHLIRTATDEDVFRVNPLQWASERSVDEYEAVDLFLHGAKAGLFYMDWNVICECCGKVMHSLRDLHGLDSRNTCTVCFRRERATLDDYVQVTFTVSPSVRSIRFHRPETLSLDDYCFTYLFEPSARVAGRLTTREAMALFNRHLSPFLPGEHITVETTADPGILSCSDVFGVHSFALLVRGEPAPEPQKVEVAFTDRGFELSLPELEPGEFELSGWTYSGRFYEIRPGTVVIEFDHRTTVRTALAVIYFPIYGLPPASGPLGGVIPLDALGPGEAPGVGFATPRLTAKRLFATQTFHDLFRAEAFRETEGFAVKDVTILFTDLKGSTQLYERIGDLNAYELVREHYGILSHAVARRHGAVVKTIGDAIMATFDQPSEAVAAGLDMLRELHEMNRLSVRGDLVLKIGIHHGAAISVTLNDRIDYFGQTVNIASRVQGSAGGDEMYLTEEMFTAPGVSDTLDESGCRVEPLRVPLRGMHEPMAVYKVTSPSI